MTAILCASCSKVTNQNQTDMNLTQEWDKVFPQSDKVNHQKVTFQNNYGITLAADLYIPKRSERLDVRPLHCEKLDSLGNLTSNSETVSQQSGLTSNSVSGLPAIAVSGPFGAVKEQSSGLYAQTMAERGFVTLAFDPSFTGESSGEPRYTASPDINTEDFMAAVDYLSTLPEVDADRIGIIGICGWGGIALNAAAADTRIKATVASTMYDMTRVNGNGYFDSANSEEARHTTREALAEARKAHLQSGEYALAGGVIDQLPDDAPQFVKDYYAYYKTPRGYHKRSGNSNGGWHTFGTQAYANARFLYYINEIRSAVLVMHGEKAHSRYFGEDAYHYMVDGKANGYRSASGGDNQCTAKPNPCPENKELLIIPNATHCDLYDGGEGNYIPWDKLEDFFSKNM